MPNCLVPVCSRSEKGLGGKEREEHEGVEEEQPWPRYCLLDASAVNGLDMTAVRTLLQLHKDLEVREGVLGFECLKRHAGRAHAAEAAQGPGGEEDIECFGAVKAVDPEQEQSLTCY